MKSEPAGKHFNNGDRRVNKKKIVIAFLLFLLLVFAFFTLLIPKNKGNLEENNTNESANVSSFTNQEVENVVKEKNIVDVDMPDKIENYDVLGQIVVKE